MFFNNSDNNEKMIRIIRKCMKNEGGYADNPNRIDQPTNIGITQPTLNKYNADHPNFYFPATVKDLTPEQVQQIYTDDYYDARHIGEIKNERIATAIFDMGVMSNFKNVIRLVQKTLNGSMGEQLALDGIIGNNTINALNDIPVYKINDFMNTLKCNRLKYLRTLSGWDKFGRGWTKRTNAY